jgi:hypothetical protein
LKYYAIALLMLITLQPLYSASLEVDTNTLYHEIKQQAPTLNQQALKLGLEAYEHAKDQGLDQKNILTIVDYSQPSLAKRLWVLQLDESQPKVLFHQRVTHGSGSGEGMATQFSNQSNSHESSLGLYETQQSYYGAHGYSLRINGLEKGYNDHARARAIVVHGAPYANDNYAQKYGRLGGSWGCFALDEHASKPIIDTIKEGTLLFAYYPDQQWIQHSAYLS